MAARGDPGALTSAFARGLDLVRASFLDVFTRHFTTDPTGRQRWYSYACSPPIVVRSAPQVGASIPPRPRGRARFQVVADAEFVWTRFFMTVPYGIGFIHSGDSVQSAQLPTTEIGTPGNPFRVRITVKRGDRVLMGHPERDLVLATPATLVVFPTITQMDGIDGANFCGWGTHPVPITPARVFPPRSVVEAEVELISFTGFNPIEYDTFRTLRLIPVFQGWHQPIASRSRITS